jgi:Domain of unknown function (DUF4349)
MRDSLGRCHSAARRSCWAVVPGIFFITTGCGEVRYAASSAKTAEMPPPPAAAPAEAEAFRAESAATAAPPAAGAKPGGSNATPIPAIAPRKIVYNATLTLVVESLAAFEQPFLKLVNDSGGYVSQSDRTSNTDTKGRSTLTVRLPVEKFEPFLTAVGRMGELQHSHVDSQDVTQEFYDLEARIANKQEEEKRLLKHLNESTGKLEDILAVEREVTRVRGEVEQMQGRLRYLANVSALSTVTVTASEVSNFVPPIQPTFAGQIRRTFNDSLDTLVGFGKAVILIAVAVAPWLPVILVVGLVLLWLVKKSYITLGRPGFTSPRAPVPPGPSA